jgi:hypothetical protein
MTAGAPSDADRAAPHRRRWWRVPAWCLAIGVATNVLMCWVIALRAPHPESATAGMLTIGTPMTFPRPPHSNWMLPPTMQTAETWGVDVLRAWMRVGTPSSYNGANWRVFRVGRPWRAMEWTYWEMPPPGLLRAGGVLGIWEEGIRPPWIARTPRVFDEDWRRLAVRPVWSGFWGNSACFAAVAGLGWLLMVPLQRSRRRRRGLCAGCGYDRHGLDAGARCPECGRSGT